MTEEQLREIEERAEEAATGVPMEHVRAIIERDVPALIAEVRRLQIEFDTLKPKADAWDETLRLDAAARCWKVGHERP